MIKALYTSATGMRAQQQLLDVTANNLANVNTTGFKKSRMDFQDLLYDTRIMPGTQVASNLEIPTGHQVGSGARSISTTKMFQQGTSDMTDRDLDVAIIGRGFFQVTMPDGTTAYTRDGSFRTDSEGTLTTAEGLRIAPSITIPQGSRVAVGKDGTISAADPSDSSISTTVGQLTLATFPNPTGLLSLGGNLYAETPSSGSPTTGQTPGQDGVGQLQGGALEHSNVEVVVELVNLITAQRAYEVNSRAIRSSDDMLAAANQMTR